MDALLKQYEYHKAQEVRLVRMISKMAIQGAVAENKTPVIEQKTAFIKEFIIKLMDKNIVIDKMYEKDYIYREDYLKINITLLHTLYMSNGGDLSKKDMRYRLNLLGYPKSAKQLCWMDTDSKTRTTRGYKLYKPKP